MKPVLAWLKKNWIIPSLCLFVVVVLATTWWFSSSWNEQIRTDQQKAASDLLNRVTSTKVTYALPMVAGDAKAVEQSNPPNSVLTAKYAERKKQLMAQRESVVKVAEAFNKGDKKPLVEGLFPAPAAGQEQLKPLELAQKLAGNPARGTHSAYQDLLDSLRAGGPVVPAQLDSQLNDVYRREAEKIRGSSGNRPLTQQENETLSRLLLDTRRNEYTRRANEISIYADMSVFPSAGGAAASGNMAPGAAAPVAGANQILLAVPGAPPNLRQAFLWQADYWLLQDIFAIIRNANMGPDGKLLSARNAVVKRIEKIEILPWRVQTTTEGQGGGGDFGGGQPAATGGEFQSSITGHSDSAAGNSYDTRRARVTLVVSSARLPELFDAIGRTNFAFVVGFAMDHIDGWQDLSQGYYYGDENVVRVLLDIELTWLRSWTEPLFPPTVRKALGLPDPAPENPPADPNHQGPK